MATESTTFEKEIWVESIESDDDVRKVGQLFLQNVKNHLFNAVNDVRIILMLIYYLIINLSRGFEISIYTKIY